MLRSVRLGTVLTCMTIPLDAQEAKDFVPSFLEAMGRVHTSILLAAEQMPREKYSFAATPRQLTFGSLVAAAGNSSAYFCSRISGVRDSTVDINGRESKPEVIAKLRSKFAFCARTGGMLDTANLSKTIQENGARSRSASMMRATASWSAMLIEVELYVRLNGLIPRRPCFAANGEGSCDNSINRCRATSPGLNGLRLTLADGPYSVRSDGRGAYVHGQSNVVQVVAGRAGVMVLGPAKDGEVARSISVDLRRPVPGGGGKPLGIISDDRNIEVAAQWMRDSNYVTSSIRDIPVGKSVEARQIDVGLHIDGTYHVLQVGPQSYGHCWSDGTAIHGTGTTVGTIRRVSDEKWTVDLTVGSIGRLFDVHLSSPHAIDKGLYYVSLHFDIER
jgi:hypothetical protein